MKNTYLILAAAASAQENAALRAALVEMVEQFGHYCENTEDLAEIKALEQARAALAGKGVQS